MSVIILTGPPGAGKNTIAKILAQKHDACAVVDVDQVRWMVLNPHKAPWEGEEGHCQQQLGAKNACVLTKSFSQNNFDVIILDVLSDETAQIFLEELNELNPKIVLLMPTKEEIDRRNTNRPPRLKEEEIANLYDEQNRLKTYNEKIDNSSISAEETAEKINLLW